MKKFALIFLIGLLFNGVFAQKVAFVNTDSVFAKLPAMQDAQKKLNDFLSQVQQEYNKMNQEYQQKLVDYQNSKDTLTPFIAQNKEKELQELNKKIQDFQVQAQTQYLQMQKDLLEPIQKDFDAAIKKIAKQKGYIAIYQITPNLLYYDPKYDITNLILKELGVNVK